MADHDVATKPSTATMDIREQERTFAGFIKVTVWTLVVVAVILVFMALSNA